MPEATFHPYLSGPSGLCKCAEGKPEYFSGTVPKSLLLFLFLSVRSKWYLSPSRRQIGYLEITVQNLYLFCSVSSGPLPIPFSHHTCVTSFSIIWPVLKDCFRGHLLEVSIADSPLRYFVLRVSFLILTILFRSFPSSMFI